MARTRSSQGAGRSPVEPAEPARSRPAARTRGGRRGPAVSGTPNLLGGLLARMSVGIAVVDAKRAVLYTNQAADSMLSARAGLVVREGRLTTAIRQRERCFQAAVRRVITDPAQAGDNVQGLLALPRHLDVELLGPVEIVILRVADGVHAQCAAVLMFDPDRLRRVDRTVLRALYGLTAAESGLLGLLLRGLTLVEAARVAATSVPTMRSRMRSLLRKTGARRQAELLARIASGSALALLAGVEQLDPVGSGKDLPLLSQPVAAPLTGALSSERP